MYDTFDGTCAGTSTPARAGCKKERDFHAHDSHIQLQGRRGQDDHGGQPRQHLRLQGPPGPPDRPRPAGVGDRLLRPLREGLGRGQDLNRAPLRRQVGGGGGIRGPRGEPLGGAIDHRARRPERAAAQRAAPEVRPGRRLRRLRHMHHRLLARDEEARVQRLPRRRGRRHRHHSGQARLDRHEGNRAHGRGDQVHRRGPEDANPQIQDSAHLRAGPHDQRGVDRRPGARQVLP